MSTLGQPAITVTPGQTVRTAPVGRWSRMFVPSFSDFAFIFLILWLFVFSDASWQPLLGDGDTGWHIRVGETILETGAVPYTDPFSFSKPDAPWYAWEWLAEVVLALLHQWLALKGIVLFGAVMIALFAVLYLRYLFWRGSNTLIALAVTLLAAGAASVHYLARPHLFTFVFLTGAIWMVEHDRRAPGWAIWLLVPLTVLWTNLHGGFPVLFTCLGGVVAGSFLEGVWDRGARPAKWREMKRYSVLGVACFAASFVNPYGWKLHQHIWAYLQSDWIKRVVAEFQSPSFRAENVLQYEILLFLGLISVGALLLRKKVVESIWILLWAHFSLSSARHIPIFAIFAGPLIASELTRWWRQWSAVTKPSSVVGILDQLSRDLTPGFRRSSLWPAAFVVFLLLSGPSLMRWPADFPEAEFPIELIRRNAARIADSRVFTDDEWADYLIYHYYPRQKVFMDGRTDFYGSEIGDKYLKLLYGSPGWERVIADYSLDLILISEDKPLASLLLESGEWVAADRDSTAILFVPRT